jgi:hypothetical protein
MKKNFNIFALILCLLSLVSCSSFKSEKGDKEEEAVFKKKRINPNV